MGYSFNVEHINMEIKRGIEDNHLELIVIDLTDPASFAPGPPPKPPILYTKTEESLQHERITSQKKAIWPHVKYFKKGVEEIFGSTDMAKHKLKRITDHLHLEKGN